MTIMSTEPVEVVEETTEDEINHYACCVDKNKAVCGTDVEEVPEDPATEIDCVVCVDLWRHAAERLLAYRHVHCPLNERIICPVEPPKRQRE